MPSQPPSGFDHLFPYLCGFLFVIVVVGLYLFVEFKVIPEQYYAKPWGENAVTSILGIEVDSLWKFLFIFVLNICLSGTSSFVARAMSVWEWELVNFSSTRPGGSSS